MNAPQTRRGVMPQVFDIKKNDFVKAKASFGGIKRCSLFRQLPYFNYSKPQIRLTVSIKKKGYKLEDITIRCYEPPKARDEHSSLEYLTVWSAKSDVGMVKRDFEYKITLPELKTGGEEYTYHLGVILGYIDKNGQKATFEQGGLILATGNISYREQVYGSAVSHIIYLLIGSGITFLAFYLLQCIID